VVVSLTYQKGNKMTNAQFGLLVSIIFIVYAVVMSVVIYKEESHTIRYYGNYRHIACELSMPAMMLLLSVSLFIHCLTNLI
jgi:hypothetical protein